MNFADLGAAKYIVQNCRARDRAEIEALYGLEASLTVIPEWASSAVLFHIFDDKDGKPVAFVAAHENAPTSVSLSMLATEHWPRVASSVIKWAKREAMPALLARGYRRAEARSIEGHPEAIRFLTRLGFQVEAYVSEFGRNGEDFIQFAVTRNRLNVFRLSQDSTSPQATDAGRRISSRAA